MKNFRCILLVIIIGFYSCDTVIYEFNIKESDISNKTEIMDSLIIRNLILSNDTISGYSEWTEDYKNKLPDSIINLYFRKRFDTSLMNNFKSIFYLIDTINVNDNVGYLIMTNYKILIGKGYERTLYLSLFNKDRNYIKTYVVAKGEDKGDGLIGGSTRIKSNLTKQNILTTYYHYLGYLDIGPHILEDSVITTYDLTNFSILKIDTIKHVDKIGYK